MWVIIEGSDYAGKSTLVTRIAELCEDYFAPEQIQLLHRGRPDPETREAVLYDYVHSLIDHHSDTNDIVRNERAVISDRWHFGEATYAPLKRPHTNKDGFGLLGTAGFRFVELFLLSRGACTFWLQPPLDILISRSGRGDDYIKVDELIDIVRLYEQTMPLSPTMRGKFTHQDDIEAVAKLVLATAFEYATQAAKLVDYSVYIGRPDPSVLIVTDTHLTPTSADSELLYESLPEYFWDQVGIVNINDIGLELGSLHSALGAPPLITLGENAVVAVHDIAVTDEFTMLQSPAWVLKFEPERAHEYGEAVRAVANGGEADPLWRL